MRSAYINSKGLRSILYLGCILEFIITITVIYNFRWLQYSFMILHAIEKHSPSRLYRTIYVVPQKWKLLFQYLKTNLIVDFFFSANSNFKTSTSIVYEFKCSRSNFLFHVCIYSCTTKNRKYRWLKYLRYAVSSARTKENQVTQTCRNGRASSNFSYKSEQDCIYM